MKEVNRFSIRSDDKITRTIVRLDDNGFYHIDVATFRDPDKINVLTGDITPLGRREDIHGSMDEKAYINWLTNALFNNLYIHAGPLEKYFMMDDPHEH